MPGLAFFPSDTKRDLLKLMKQQGTISLDDAEAATGLTRTTLREHLGQLERDGLVARSAKRQGRGRPSLRYNLTTDGEGLFPSRDNVLLGHLLAFLKQQGQEELIKAFFEQFWAVRLRDVEYRLSALDPGNQQGRLEVLEHLLREQGFMPEIRQDEAGIVIRECNCPFPEAVKHTRLPCRLEAQFFEHIFGKHIARVAYIPDGSPACTYEFPHQEAA
jgi:predicted ArsR family transcriptional regulator